MIRLAIALALIAFPAGAVDQAALNAAVDAALRGR